MTICHAGKTICYNVMTNCHKSYDSFFWLYIKNTGKKEYTKLNKINYARKDKNTEQ